MNQAATPAEAPNPNAVQRRPQDAYDIVVQVLKSNNGSEAKAIRAMLGGDKALMDRFLATTFALLARNSDVLRQCTPASIVQAIKDAASLGLEPETQDGSLVPFANQAVFMPSWQGHLKRIRNSGRVQDVDCQVVYEKDEWSYWYDSERGFCFIHKPSLERDRGGYKGAYAYAIMPSGFREGEWMPEDEIIAVRDRFSKGHTKSDSPWRTRPGEMYRKTVLNVLHKRLPQSAVDQLLLRDPDSTLQTSSAIEVAVEPIRDELASIRQLALQRVSDNAPANGDAKQITEGIETQGQPPAQADAGPSHCDAIHPQLGDCAKPFGHGGNHGNKDGETWK